VFAAEKGPLYDIAALNAAAALVVAGQAGKLANGLALARETLISSAAQRTRGKLIACSRQDLWRRSAVQHAARTSQYIDFA
jgi:anthranilate phosphoribosyltransferase